MAWIRPTSIASFLVIGGCQEAREKSSLKSIENIVVENIDEDVKISTKISGLMNIPRRSPSVFKLHDHSVILGGCLEEGVHLKSAEIMGEPSTIDLGIGEQSCAAYCQLKDNVGIVCGGYDGMDCLKEISLVWYEDQEVKAKVIGKLLTRLKNSVAVPVDEQSCLLFGGWDERETMKTVYRLTFSDAYNSFECCMESVLPYAVEGHSQAKLGNNVFLIGGYDGISVVNTILHYDLCTKESKILPTRLQIARENHVSTVVFEKYLIVLGGWNGRHALDSIEVFRILEEFPFLEPVDCQTTLIEARNRPGLID